MTQGETLFYLREIHPHWSTSNVSVEKLSELEAGKLIEISGPPVQAVRLTSEGARLKNLGRPAVRSSSISLTRKANSFRHRPRAKKPLPPKRFV